jgi:hypothetical protein
MPSKDKKGIFKLPLKFVFTEEGASVFMRQNKKLVRLIMGDYTEEYGVALREIAAETVQRMVVIDYISKIEASGIEPVSSRMEIIDLCKLVIYGLLYRQYNLTVFSLLVASEPVKKWNRANPFTVIDEKTRFQEGFLDLFLHEHAGEIEETRKALLKPLREAILGNEQYQADEKNTQLLLSEKFLDMINPIVWFILLKFRGTRDFLTLLGSIRTSLSEYLAKSAVAEYAALMIIELAVNIENLNMLREARQMDKKLDIKTILADPQLRNILMEQLRKKNNLITFSWKIGGGSAFIGARSRFQLTIYDRVVDFKEIKDSIDATKSADLYRKNLSDYYKELSGDDSELGIYYLSYLNEACERMGIKFESRVNQVRDTTFTTLSFYL